MSQRPPATSYGWLAKAAACAAIFALAGGASAQTAGAASGPPDLSGYFRQGTSVYQPPARGGQGPLGNSPRYTPDVNGRGNLWVGDFENPMLQPRTAAEIKRLGELELEGGGSNLTSYQLCQLLGVPLILTQRDNIQILQTSDKITIIYDRDNQIRHIYLDVPHSENVEPSWYGESVGHYEGDTLVVDTVGQNGLTRVDRYGSFSSPSIHVIERYHINGEGQLQVDFTLEDPETFTMAWGGTQIYRRSDQPWEEIVCAENNRDARTGVDYADMPMAARADF